MGEGMSMMAKRELPVKLSHRYRMSSKEDRTRILDEFIAVPGHHRKHGIRLLAQTYDNEDTNNRVRQIPRTEILNHNMY